ncbi:MAG: M24 family metallopeptidase [Nitrospinota bacterium]
MLIDRERAADEMARAGYDALIATSPENVVYASGFESLGQWLIPGVQVFAVVPMSPSLPVAVVAPLGELDRAAESHEVMARIHPYGVFFMEIAEGERRDEEEEEERLQQIRMNASRAPAPAAALRDALGYLGVADVGVLGLDEGGLDAPGFASLCEALSQSQIDPACESFRRIRRIKTPEEVRRLRRAVEIAEEAIEEVLRAAEEGMTEREMAQVYECALIRLGARPSLTVIGVGPHSAFPNGRPSDRRLRAGDLIRFDVGCRYLCYHSDIARTAVLGDPVRRQKEVYAALLTGHLAALDRVRAGTPAREIFQAAVSTVRSSGLPRYDRHHVGHGIGLELYEPPILNEKEGRRLEAGMVVNVEPPYYELGFGGLQVEDTLLVTEEGFECLNRMPKGLISIRS